jgi:hypothetical protein
MDFISLSISEPNYIAFRFKKDENNLGEIHFSCEDVELMEEKMITQAEYDKLL